MQYLSNKNGFLGIDNKFNFKEKVVIVPFGLEKTVSYGGGTKNGPKEIIKASHQVELYDEELKKESHKHIGLLSYSLDSKLDAYKYHFGETDIYKEVTLQHSDFLEEHETLINEFFEWIEVGD